MLEYNLERNFVIKMQSSQGILVLLFYLQSSPNSFNRDNTKLAVSERYSNTTAFLFARRCVLGRILSQKHPSFFLSRSYPPGVDEGNEICSVGKIFNIVASSMTRGEVTATR